MIPVERKGYVCGGILVVVILVLAAVRWTFRPERSGAR